MLLATRLESSAMLLSESQILQEWGSTILKNVETPNSEQTLP
jgi:hypothetical protein